MNTASAAGDPTKPSSYKPSKVAEKATIKQVVPVLSGIFYKDQRYFAILDDKKYQVGEHYGENKVIKITADRVVLRSQNGTYQLKLFDPIKK